MVIDLEDGCRIPRFLIFDLLCIDGCSIVEKPFTSRLGRLNEFIIKPYQQRMKLAKSFPSSSPSPFRVELKKLERSYALNRVLDSIESLKHANDGLLFTSAVAGYRIGTCDKMLKWKPPELNSIDFRVY